MCCGSTFVLTVQVCFHRQHFSPYTFMMVHYTAYTMLLLFLATVACLQYTKGITVSVADKAV